MLRLYVRVFQSAGNKMNNSFTASFHTHADLQRGKGPKSITLNSPREAFGGQAMQDLHHGNGMKTSSLFGRRVGWRRRDMRLLQQECHQHIGASPPQSGLGEQKLHGLGRGTALLL